MRLFHTAILGALIALPVAISGTIVPAHAQQNGVLGQAQRFLNGNQNQDQNAYEQGRRDQMQQEQARRQQWSAEHGYGDNQDNPRYGSSRYGQSPPPAYGNRYDNGYGNNYSHNNSGDYNNGYDR